MCYDIISVLLALSQTPSGKGNVETIVSLPSNYLYSRILSHD